LLCQLVVARINRDTVAEWWRLAGLFLQNFVLQRFELQVWPFNISQTINETFIFVVSLGYIWFHGGGM
jgi:hypothetical protein